MPPNLAVRKGKKGRTSREQNEPSGVVPPEYDLWSRVFKALAHPVRLYIAEQVRIAPRSVGQLARLVRLDSSTVCRHLWLLKNAGLIHSQKRGT